MKKIGILIVAVSTFIVGLTRAQEVHRGESFELDSPLTSNQSIEYKANDFIHLKKGFQSLPQSPNYAMMEIDPYFNPETPYGLTYWKPDDFSNCISQGRLGFYPMDFDVNENGAAVISMPLEFPEGINGMTPHLSLNYNSQGGNGILGLGWSLGGMSKISRVPYAYMYDDSCHAVQFSNIDELSLDGVVLRKGRKDNVVCYYPEIYDYSIVYPIDGNIDNGFRVLKKDGNVYTYDAKYYLQSALGTPIEWHLSRVEDPFGNYIEYNYQNDRNDGAFYPISICYTGHAGLPPKYEIRFEYASDDRNDCPPKYFSRPDSPNSKNGFSRITKKINAIHCCYEGCNIMSYNLTYSTVASDWNIRMLSSIEKQFFDNQGAKWSYNLVIPTEFQWKVTDYQLQYETATNGAELYAQFDNNTGGWHQHTAFAARFEHNEVAMQGIGPQKFEHDIVHLMQKDNNSTTYFLNVIRRYNVVGELGQSYNIGNNLSYDCQNISNTLSNGRTILAFMPADTDGDGLNEIMCASYYPSDYSVRISLLKPNATDVFYEQDVKTMGGANSTSFSDFSIADFNGDGLSDLFCMFNGYPMALMSTSNNPFELPVNCDSYYGTSINDNLRIVIGDFNGDKKDQIILIGRQPSGNYTTYGKYLRITETTGGLQFSSPKSIEPSIQNMYYGPHHRYRLCSGDFNGDGKKDILLHCAGNWYFYYSQGNGSFCTYSNPYQESEIVGDDIVCIDEGNENNPTFAIISDFDNDGCDDISYVWVERFMRPSLDIPNHDVKYCGVFRKDFLIRPTQNAVRVKKIENLRSWYENGHQQYADICIDSIRESTTITNPFLPIIGNHKGTSPTEIMCCRIWIPSSSNSYKACLNNTGCLDNPPVRAINKIVTSLGATTEIEYRPVSYQFLRNENYGREGGGLREFNRDLTPVLPYNGYLNIVEKVLTETEDIGANSNTEKTFRMTRYHFWRPYYHTRGRGFLGFNWIWSRQQGQQSWKDIINYQYFSLNQTYSIMVPEKSLSRHFVSSSNHSLQTYLETNFVYDFHTNNNFNSVLGQIPNDVFSPYLQESITQRNDGSPVFFEKETFQKNGYGNVVSHQHRYGSSTTNFPYYENEETTYNNNPGENRWILGVPESETLTQYLSGNNTDVVTKYTTYQNNMNTGRHTEKCTEQGNEKQLTESYSYDGFGNLVSTTAAGSGETRTEGVAYSTDGRFPISKTNALGQTTTYTFDEATGRTESITDPNGLTTRYHYDILGNLIQTEYPSGVLEDQSMMWVGNSQNQYYHPDTPNFGCPIYFTYSKRSGERESYVFYDQHNRKLREVSCSMSGEKKYVDYKYYKFSGLLNSVSVPYFPDDESPVYTNYDFDYLGRNIMIVRHDNNYTSHTYNGSQESIRGFDGLVTTLTYNITGQIIKSSLDVNNPSADVNYAYYGDGKLKQSCINNDMSTAIVYTYDANRNPLTICDPSLGEMTYDYNAFGELVGSTTPRDETSYTYDALGRMTQRNGSDGNSYWHYDNDFIGALSSANYVPISGPTVKESYQYDQLGNLIRQTQKAGNEEEWTFNYTYNSLGEQSSITYPSGKKVKYHYNGNGFMDYVKDAATGDVLWQANASDRWDNISSFTEGTIDVEYSYDPVTGFVNSIEATLNDQILLDQEYHWTTTGNLQWRTDATLDLKESFGYDGFNRLTSALTRDLSESQTYSSQSFNYDSYGNITEKTGVGSYAYGSNASPYAVTGLQPETGIEALFTHQEANYTSFDKLQTLAQDGKTLGVNYGIDRQRVMQTFSDGNTTRTKRYFTPLYETVTEDGVTKNYHYLTAANGLFAIFVTSSNGEEAMYYTMKDHQGSLAAVIHPDGDVERLSYDAWGRRRNPVGFGYDNLSTATFDRGFTLHEHYDDFGLINMNGRMYDPAVGRMLSPDIVIQQEHNSQAYNRYSYCFNNPLRFTDPSGYVVDIPPEYFEIEEYIRYNDTKSLKDLGVTNYSSNTEEAEGKMVTTTTWMCDDREYKLITHSRDFPFYEQHFKRSCLAISTVAQEISNGLELDNKMILLSEIVNMTCFNQPNAFEDGLVVDAFLRDYTNDYSCAFSSSKSHLGSILNTNLDYLLSEFDKGNGAGFVVHNDNWTDNHFVNMTSYSKLYENDSYQDYNIKVWDSDFYNQGALGGINNLQDYQHLLKINIMIK